MHVLVIGGTGFIGRYVVELLAAEDHAVTVLHRGHTQAALLESIESIFGDFHEPGILREAVETARAEVVLHVLPFTEPDAQDLLTACRGRARHIVALSSQDVYRAFGRVRRTEPGEPVPVPLAEDAPLRDVFFCEKPDHEKILVERTLLAQQDLPVTILRLPMVYGPGDAQHRLFVHLKRMDDRRPAILMDEGLARWRWTRGYVENVADAIAVATTREPSEHRIFNLGDPDTLSMAEWVQAIGEAAGWAGRIVIAPLDVLPPELLVPFDTSQDMVVDTNRARREFGLRDPVSRDEALRRTIAWERANPPARINPALFNYTAEDAVLAALLQ